MRFIRTFSIVKFVASVIDLLTTGVSSTYAELGDEPSDIDTYQTIASPGLDVTLWPTWPFTDGERRFIEANGSEIQDMLYESYPPSITEVAPMRQSLLVEGTVKPCVIASDAFLRMAVSMVAMGHPSVSAQAIQGIETSQRRELTGYTPPAEP